MFEIYQIESTLLLLVIDNKGGGSVMVLVSSNLDFQQISADVMLSISDAFNCCAVVIGKGSKLLIVIVVYKLPWALAVDTEKLRNEPDVIVKFKRVIIAGDFNITLSGWINLQSLAAILELLSSLVIGHSIKQLAYMPTRGTTLIDLVFISEHFLISVINDLAPVSSSDHSAPLIKVPIKSDTSHIKWRKKIDLNSQGKHLSCIDCTELFVGCIDVNEYTAKFML